MRHSIHRVSEVRLVGSYVVDVDFADGTSQRTDLGSVLAGEIYGPLRDQSLFDKVSIDPEIHTLVWPNGADFDPAILHDWPACKRAFELRARQWETVTKQERTS